MRKLIGYIRVILAIMRSAINTGQDVLWTRKLQSNANNDTSIRRIALVRLDAIGDIFIWLQSASAYRSANAFKNDHITVIVNHLVADFLSMTNLFDKVIPVEINRFSTDRIYRTKILVDLASRGFNITIHSTFSRHYEADLISRATAAPQCIASVGDQCNHGKYRKKLADSWYTKLVPASDKPIHELERNLEFLSQLGWASAPFRLPQLFADTVLPDIYSTDIILFPGASSAIKTWPPERFAQVARKINDSERCRFIICGGPQDVNTSSKLIEQLGSVENVDLTGKTSLIQLAGILQQARLLITNDTSAVHLAALAQTPSICLVGGGHYGRFLPYPEDYQPAHAKPATLHHSMPCFNCNWRCVFPRTPDQPAPCISNIQTDQVISLALSLLASPRVC